MIILYILRAFILPSSAQAPAQLSWAELALILFPPAPARPHGRPPVRTSSEIMGNQLNLISNNCRSTPVEHESIFFFWKCWRQPQLKITSMEEDLNKNIWKSIKLAFKFCIGILWKSLEQFSKVSKYGRQPQWKMNPMEDDLNGRQPQCKMTSMQDYLNGKRLEIKKTCFRIFVFLIKRSLEQFPNKI